MPVLLDLKQAPQLSDLLSQADTKGLTWHLSTAKPGSPLPRIAGLGTLASAGPCELAFLTNSRYQPQLAACRAAAVILSPSDDALLDQDTPFVRIVCDRPYLLYALVAQWFDRALHPRPACGVHPSAIVAADAHVDPSATVGAHCVIESEARIGAHTVLGPACVIGRKAVVGTNGLLHARVTLYEGVKVGDRVILHSGVVLGADGFGLAPDPESTTGAWSKIPQLGAVQVGDDVEIGANTTVDRGALEDTTIGDGVKLDNQIMVAHNVRIGAHTAIAACVGIAGSTTIGQRCTIGGAAMLSGHIHLTDDVHVSGGTAITSNISIPGRYTGVYPYAKHTEWQKNAAVIQQLGKIRHRLRALEKP